MNFKKIAAGHYTLNRYEILKNDNGTWQVTKGTFGDKDYWIDTFDSFEKALNYGKSFELCFIDLDVRGIDSGFRSSICKVKNGDVTMIHGHYLTQLAKAGRYDAL